MPLKIENIKLAGTKFDGRAKLSPEQRQAIQILAREGYSQRRLAAMFNVSKRLIQSILSPPVRKHSKQYPTEYWTELKRKCRKKKIDLYKNGKNHLRIRHVKNITGKITTTLKEIFPVFNFYWKTPRLLVWF